METVSPAQHIHITALPWGGKSKPPLETLVFPHRVFYSGFTAPCNQYLAQGWSAAGEMGTVQHQ